MNSKKAQVWYIDLIIGLLIFTLAVVMFQNVFGNLSAVDASMIIDLYGDAKSISSSLLSKGYPENWNNATIERIGIADNYRINSTKLDNFMNLSYNRTRNLLGTNYEYWVFFEDRNHTLIQINGKNGTGYKYGAPEKLAQVVRLVVKDSQIVRMVVQVWH